MDDGPTSQDDQRDPSAPSDEQIMASPWAGYEPPTPPPYEPDTDVEMHPRQVREPD